MFKASELVAFCLSMIGMPYWYGTCVYRCAESLRKRKAEQYPSHYSSGRTATYQKHIAKKLICMDCVGMIKGFFWTNGGAGVVAAIGTDKTFSSKYGGNGMPDKSANGLLSWCKSKKCAWGTIDKLPDVPGILLFSPGHVGVYVGGGYAVEARGFAYGVVKTKVASRKWTTWAYLPESLLKYDLGEGVAPEAPSVSVPEKEYTLGERDLEYIKPNLEGKDVADLQTRLNALGYDCGKVDGIFGRNTEKALKAFQKVARIEVDGIFGPESLKALNSYEKPAEPEEKPADNVIEHTVQRGDTLWEIAKKYLGKGSRYPEIMELNGLTSTTIRTGKVLKIPTK